jgi:hypothetical protein
MPAPQKRELSTPCGGSSSHLPSPAPVIANGAPPLSDRVIPLPAAVPATRNPGIASSRGGFYTASSPPAFIDHQETFLTSFFGYIGIGDAAFVRAEGRRLGPEGCLKTRDGLIGRETSMQRIQYHRYGGPEAHWQWHSGRIKSVPPQSPHPDRHPPRPRVRAPTSEAESTTMMTPLRRTFAPRS